MISGWRNAFHALCLVVAGALLVTGFSRVIDQPFWLGLYDHSFAFVPGEWVANRLNDAAQDPERTCVFVGASVVREGIDAEIVAAQMPGTRVVNIATTGGYSAVDVLDIQAKIMRQRGERYHCIVVGLNKFYVRDLLPDSYELMVSDYASQLSVSSLISLAGREQVARQVANLALKYSMPLGRHSLIVQRIVRSAMADYHARLLQRVSGTDFELFAGELKEGKQYMYTGPSIYTDAVARASQALSDFDMESATSFGSLASKSALEGAMLDFAAMTDSLYVVNMPLTSVYDKTEAAAAASYDAAMVEVPVRRAIDCSVPVAEEATYYYDSSHLLENGRIQLSRDIGAILEADMAGGIKSGRFC